MDSKRQKEILMLAMRAGDIMMKSGAEIGRVEDTIERICKACDIKDVNTFAMPSGIFVSTNNEEASNTVTHIKRIKSNSTELQKISRVNEFSRTFTTTDMTVEEGMRVLDEIEKLQPYPMSVRVVSAAVVTACFTLMFGGNALCFGVSFCVGMMCYLFSYFLNRYDINFFIKGFCSTAMATFFALLCANSIDGVAYEPVVSGCIMLFVPGVAITNSIRALLSGEMLSGLAKLTEAALIGVSLAAGAGLVIEVWILAGGISL